MVIILISDPEGSAGRFPVWTYKFPSGLLTQKIWGHANIMFWLKNQKIFLTACISCNPTSWRIKSTTFVPSNGRWHHCGTRVLYAWHFGKYWGDWLSIKFCENDSFRKLFLFFENTFQYLGEISQDIAVSHFDSHRSLSSANRRRSTSPILFVSFTQPCDQHDKKIRTIRKSAARWRGRRAQGYRKLILRAILLYVPNIKM